MKLADAGCGDGVNLKLLSTINGAELWGIEYNPLRAKRAQQAVPDISILVADLTQPLPFPEGYFDVVLLSQVIEHVRDDFKLLRTLKAVLAPDGMLILGTPNEGCMLARLRNRVIEPQIARTTDHVNFYTEKRIRRLFDRSGFRVVDVLYENFFFPITRLDYYFASRDCGMNLMAHLGRLFRSQVGGYYFALVKQ
jgi:SAM-dependent methyltransferase